MQENLLWVLCWGGDQQSSGKVRKWCSEQRPEREYVVHDLLQREIMADSELIRTVNEILTDSFEIAPERLTPEAEIFVDLELDSLDMVDLAASLQRRFGVSIRDNDRIRSIRTMQDLYDYMIVLSAGK